MSRPKPFKLPKRKKPYSQAEKIYFALLHMSVGLDACYAGLEYINKLVAANKKESDPF
jgi:hypothetical protein